MIHMLNKDIIDSYTLQLAFIGMSIRKLSQSTDTDASTSK